MRGNSHVRFLGGLERVTARANLVAMPSLAPQVGRGVALAVGIILLTWIFFAPVAAWHHIVACGVLAPVVLNAESPQAGYLLWDEYEVRFFPGRFALSVILWSFAVYLLFWLLHRKQNER